MNQKKSKRKRLQKLKKRKIKKHNSRRRKNLPKVKLDQGKLKHAMEVLESTEIRQDKKCKLPTYKIVTGNIYEDISLLSYTQLAKSIRDSILTHNWNTLTKLLICFFDVKPVLNCLKWQNAFINLLYNPNANKHDMLNEFLHMCVSCQTDSQKQKFLQRLLTIDDEDVDNTLNEMKDETKEEIDPDYEFVDFENIFSEFIGN